jgi:hypothetical protein
MRSINSAQIRLFDAYFAAKRSQAQDRKDAAAKFGIFRIKKNGTVSKLPSDTKPTLEDAELQAQYMQEINPGSKFVVQSL